MRWICVFMIVCVTGMLFQAPASAVTVNAFDFTTAALNGESPATTGQFAGPLYVRGRRPNDNNEQLEVQAFLEFDLAGLPNGIVTSATLNLHENNKLNSANSDDLYIARVAAGWNTTDNKPVFDQAIVGGSEFVFGNNGPASAGPAVDIDHSIDVQNIVQNWISNPTSNHGFRLRIADNFVGAAFDDTGDAAPSLDIEIQEITTTEFCLDDFHTANRDGSNPSTGNWTDGGPLFVRERDNNDNPELETEAQLQFDLAGLSDAPIISATLSLHEFNKLNDVNSEDLFIAALAPFAGDFAFNQAIVAGGESSFGNNGAASAGPDVDIFFNIDVTDIVTAWQANPSSNHGFRLRIGEHFVGAAFDHDGDFKPVLTIVQAVPEPATTGLIGLGIFAIAGRRRRR